MFNIIQKKIIWFSISGLLIIISLLALIFWGLKLGIDFTGGSLLELEFLTGRPTNQQIHDQLKDLNLESLQLQPTGEQGLLIRTVSLTEDIHQEILKKIDLMFGDNNQPEAKKINDEGEEVRTVPASAIGLTGEGMENVNVDITGTNLDQLNIQQVDTEKTAQQFNNFIELRFDSIGPTLGQELKHKALLSVFIVLLAIIFYIAYAFRKVSKPVESWKYGLSAIIALTHDIFIITGIYVILGHYFNFQADALFVTALLTILGFSVHDTIVTFDRIRENLYRHQEETFFNVINRSVNETIVRSLNTSLTTFFVLFAIFLFGGESIKNFVLILMLGIIIGTYSSIFIASPLLIIFYRLKKY